MSKPLVKTNIAGFVKDTKQNLLVPQDLDDKIAQVKLNRKNYKKQQGLEATITGLQNQLKSLIERVGNLEDILEEWSENKISV